MKKDKLYCYFCGSQEKEVTYLIEGDDAYICDYCVEKANLVINENDLKKYGAVSQETAYLMVNNLLYDHLYLY